MLIELRNISYTYSKGTPFRRHGLVDVSLAIRQGEWVGLIGTTGSGKSTLLQHLNGLLKPDAGEVVIDEVNIHASGENLRKARQNVGLVFQYPEHQLFGTNVYEEVAFGPENFGFSAQETEDRVKAAMETVGLPYDQFKSRMPYQLSGGEKRRVALAGVLAANPRIIALDEPTAGLDNRGKQMVIETVARLNQQYGLTVVWVTHDINEIVSVANRLIVLDSGRVALDGPLRETAVNPRLREMGLELPLAVQISSSLEKKGIFIDGAPLTVDEIKREIIHLRGKSNG